MSDFNGTESAVLNIGSENVGVGDEKYLFQNDGVCSRWIAYLFLGFLIVGWCFNLLYCFVLLRSKRNGVISIILQLSSADLILALAAFLDFTSSYYQTWKFSNTICMLYRGTNLFANSLIPYLLLCFNSHVITFCNLHKIESVKNNRNPLTSFNDSSSSECLVSSGSSEHKTINYRKRKNDVPVFVPVTCMWVLCLSLGLPDYVLSTTVGFQQKTFCVILENNYSKLSQLLVLVFSALLPIVLLLASLLILVCKLVKYTRDNANNVLTKQYEEIKVLVLSSILLSVVYLITSFRMHYLNLIVTIENVFILERQDYNTFNSVYETMLHYMGIVLRCALYYLGVPDVRRAIQECPLFK